jgi:hypothetical protein
MNGWYPFGADLADDADFSIDRRMLWHRLTERQIEVYRQELAELGIVIWAQEEDTKEDSFHIELCAFGWDGYAAKAPLHELLDKQLSYHLDPGSAIDARLELQALEDLRERIDRMIADRKKGRDEPPAESEKTE